MLADRTEWPTEARLEKLREEGRVPYSKAATALVASGVVLLIILWWLKRWDSFLVSYAALFGRQSAPLAEFAKLAGSWFEPLILANVAIIAVVLLIGLMQTKFLFRLGLVGFDLSKLRLRERKHPIAGVLVSLFWWLAGGIGAGALFYFFLPRLIAIFEQMPATAWRLFREGVTLFLPGVAVFFLCLALVVWLCGRFLFLVSNRMTRQEVEQEDRGA